jgi:hypothetical protein
MIRTDWEWIWRGFGVVDLAWIRSGSGVDLEWIWNGSGVVDLERIGSGFGVDLEWIWGGFPPFPIL